MIGLTELLIIFLIGVLASYVGTKYFIHFCGYAKLLGKDMHKMCGPEVPVTGGMGVYVGMLLALCYYVLFNNGAMSLEIFGVLLTLSIITFIGFFDDITKDKGGLEQWQKPLFTVLAVVPLMVLKLGETGVVLPFIGWVDFGLAYTFLIIPIAVIGASNMVNLLAGYNGIEAGMGIIYCLMLGIFAVVKNQPVAALIAFSAVGALLGFIYFNWFPSKIFPGDSLTYLLGATLVCISLVGNMEKAAIVVSIPFFIEGLLKLRGKFREQSFSTIKPDGRLMHTGNVYSLPQLFTRTGKFTEKQVVIIFMAIEFVISLFIWVV